MKAKCRWCQGTEFVKAPVIGDQAEKYLAAIRCTWCGKRKRWVPKPKDDGSNKVSDGGPTS